METKTPKDYGLLVDELQMDGLRPAEFEIPFELKSEDFIDFAERDLNGGSKKDIVNSLSNIKRAITNRMDSLLYAFGYSELVKEGNFPTKVEKLNKLNIIAPRILTKINKIRNMLEHEYKLPKKNEVEDALDVAILFLESTKIFVKKFVSGGEFYEGDSNYVDKYFEFEFKKNKLNIKITDYDYSAKKQPPVNSKRVKLNINSRDVCFDEWLKLIIELAYWK